MRSVLVVCVLAVGACSSLPGFLRRDDSADESLFRRAVRYLDPANERSSLDSARVLLDRYLAASGEKDHTEEAIAMRRLVEAALELERVEVVLRQNVMDTGEVRDTTRRQVDTVRVQTKGDGARTRPSAEAAREIRRLREELRDANAELERIRRRLATPKDSTDSK